MIHDPTGQNAGRIDVETRVMPVVIWGCQQPVVRDPHVLQLEPAVCFEKCNRIIPLGKFNGNIVSHLDLTAGGVRTSLEATRNSSSVC